MLWKMRGLLGERGDGLRAVLLVFLGGVCVCVTACAAPVCVPERL